LGVGGGTHLKKKAEAAAAHATLTLTHAALTLTHAAAPAQAEECLEAEERRVNSYLHIDTKPKLLREAEAELLQVHQAALLEKEGSGCVALLRDDKMGECVCGGGGG
jgi:hypothetical protein